jgi:ankyrin repeat protein
MEHPNDCTEKRRRRSPSPGLSPSPGPSPGPSRPNAELTLYSDRRLNKRRRVEEDIPNSTAGQLRGHIVSDDVARGHASVHYGDAHDRRSIDQHQGHNFHGSQAKDSARVHYGNHYGPINNYNHPPSAGPMPDTGQKSQEQIQEQNQSRNQNDIAIAMDALSFTRMDNRQANIQKAYASTCKWIFEKPEYKNWRSAELLDEHNGFFWIKSKPGAGKSTLMKFFVQSAAKQLPDDHVISFFFNARGELLEKSLEGLYRGLLHQLLTVVPRLQEVLDPKEIDSLSHQAWPLDRLKTLFGEAVLKLGRDHVTCFIDALDECPEGEIRDMIEFFEELGESTAAEDIGLRVCFSSRHYPQITMMKCQPMVLDGQDGHEDDIARYVKSKLKVRGGKPAEEVRTAVQAKAKGIFMWVVLVVRILNKESDRGGNNAKLRKCLDKIPAELHDLFQDILKRGMQDNKYLVPILQWISFAQRPLTREELYFAVRSGNPDFVASQPWDPEDDDAESMDLFILDSSKGLAEMTKGKTPTIQFIHESVRDYLRETGFATLAPELSANLLGLTHEYLKRCCLNSITQPVLVRLSPPEDLPKAKSEEAKSMRKQASELFPFLNYATDNIVFHAELACANGVDQAEFIVAMISSVWRDLASLFAIHETRRYPREVSIARKFAYAGAVHLLSSAFLDNDRKFGPDDLRTALQAAIKSRNVHLIKVLLEIIKKGAWARFTEKEERALLFQAVRLRDTTIFTALLEYGIPIPAGWALEELLIGISKAGDPQAVRELSARSADVGSWSGQALYTAIDRGLDDVAQVLLDLEATLEAYINCRGHHPLVLASGLGHAGIVRMLVTSGTCMHTITPETTGVSLLGACDKGHDSAVRVLLENGAPVNFLDSTHCTPLIRACRDGHMSVIQLLLENGADINLGDGLQTPIAAACDFGAVSVVKVLIENGADPSSPSETTPLSVAIYPFTKSIVSGSNLITYTPANIDEVLVRMLLSKSANPNVSCRIPRRMSEKVAHTEQSLAMLSRTLIYGAAITGNAEVLRLLFENGADANTEDGKDYYDALMDSCRNGREEVVKVLLANGPGIAYRDDELYRRVVEEATRNRHSRIVELAFNEGHEFCTQRQDLYSGSLQIALHKGYDEIARFLTDRGVEAPKQTEGDSPSVLHFDYFQYR